MTATALDRARLALDGLSVGDAFGERFFGQPAIVVSRIEQRALPGAPWFWTDDTAMALSVLDELQASAGIDSSSLAQRFARRYRQDSRRGYGGTAHDILMDISLGQPWREVAQGVFDGQGSMGNGSAMRVAPIGAYFADDLDAAVLHARASAEPTHAHPEGHAGAIATAVAAALAWQMGSGSRAPSGAALLSETLRLTPNSGTRDGIERALSPDTVPFALWCAARHLDDFEQALWTTVSGLGDRDTTCAITGGIVALSVGRAGIPGHFLDAREPLDSTLDYIERHAIASELGRR
jgi:ADP-ribosylglycohydrolase